MNGVKDQQISDAGSLLRRKSTLPDMQLCEDRRLMAGCRRSRAAASRMRNMKRPGLSVGQLWGNPTGGSGSFRASRRVCSPAASRVEASGIDSSRSSVRAVEGGCANETPGRRVSFVSAGAELPVLLAGSSRVPASGWDPGGRAFVFLLPAGEAKGYFRLGYEDLSGSFVLTDAFTLPRGTGSPAATGRFEEPAARP